MATLNRVQNQPGSFAFQCDCGHKRLVVDSEKAFSCERPIDPKSGGACAIKHTLPKLVEECDEREKKKAALKYVQEHEAKLKEAKDLLAAEEAKNSKKGKK